MEDGGGSPLLEETHGGDLSQYTKKDLVKYLRSIRQTDIHYSSSSESSADDGDDAPGEPATSARGEPATSAPSEPAATSAPGEPAGGSGGGTGPAEAD